MFDRTSQDDFGWSEWKQLKADVGHAMRVWMDTHARTETWREGMVHRVLSSHFAEFLPTVSDRTRSPGESDESSAIHVVLALLAADSVRPPPSRVTMAILDRFHQRAPDAATRPGRSPEIVIAYLLGWDWSATGNGEGWEPAMPGARKMLRLYVYETVESCLLWLTEHVIGFPTEDPEKWALRVFNCLTAPRRRCQCWRRVAHGLEDKEDLRGNAKRRAVTCTLGHSLHVWRPEERSLWDFCQRAVKGGTGTFRPSQFPAGMLFDRLLEDYPLGLVPVANFRCHACGTWSANAFRCPSCKAALPENLTRVALRRSWLILKDERSGFESHAVWTCAAPAKGLRGDALQSWRGQSLAASDVLDWPAFCARLRRGADGGAGPEGVLWPLLPPKAQQHLLSIGNPGPAEIDVELKELVVKSINDVLVANLISQPGDVQKALAEAQDLQAGDSETILRLNSLWLRDGFPGVLHQDCCGNVYGLRHCGETACAAGEQHDSCPLDGCGARHPAGRQRKPAHVWFYQHGCASGQTRRRGSDLEKAKEAAERHFPAGWQSGLVACLFGDLARWRWLIETDGGGDWGALRDELAARIRIPLPSLKELEDTYEHGMRQELIALIKGVLDDDPPRFHDTV